ncbi:MAG: hypothetical protein ACRDPB_07880 [Nocardioidaceae bacterium]
MFRIQPGRGTITRTPVPELRSSGPVSFVVGPEGAVVRPLDHVPGYRVPDGKPARRLHGLLSRGGLAFPGPRPGTVWVVSGDADHAALVLAGPRGRRAGARVPVCSWPLAAAGDGAVVLRCAHGGYLAGADGMRKVTPGAVLATGPTKLVTRSCLGAGCSAFVHDRRAGRKHRIQVPGNAASFLPGKVSPDGSQAAISDTPTRLLQLVDLATGAVTGTGLRLPGRPGVLAWSPGGRWLFAVTDSGRLAAVDMRSGSTDVLGRAPDHVLQIAVRR